MKKIALVVFIVLQTYLTVGQGHIDTSFENYLKRLKNLEKEVAIILTKSDSCCTYKQGKHYAGRRIVVKKESIVDSIRNRDLGDLHVTIDCDELQSGEARCPCNNRQELPSLRGILGCYVCVYPFLAVFSFAMLVLLISFYLSGWNKLKLIISESISKLINDLPLIVVSWGIGLCLLAKSICFIDFTGKTTYSQLTVLSLAIGLMLLPFIKSFKIGNLFSLERKIEETKQEVKDFKGEIRQMVTMMSNTVSNSNTLFIGDRDRIHYAKEKFMDKAGANDPSFWDNVEKRREELLTNDDDLILALARTRIKLETLLREILGKTTTLDATDRDIKFMSLSNLYRNFLKEYPGLEYTKRSFLYVQKICNAAIHGQKIRDDVAKETLEMGAALIEELSKYKNNSGKD